MVVMRGFLFEKILRSKFYIIQSVINCRINVIELTKETLIEHISLWLGVSTVIGDDSLISLSVFLFLSHLCAIVQDISFRALEDPF